MSRPDASNLAPAADLTPSNVSDRAASDVPELDDARLRGPPPAVGLAPVASDSRRHSFPLNLLLPSVWHPESTSSAPSLAASEQAANGETTRDERAAAHRAAALEQLNGVARSRHRQSKSTSAGNTTFSHPVIVRTYSGATASEQRHRIPVIREEPDMGKAELPSIEAFSFDDILKTVEPDISGALDAIAGICANSRYSLSNHYEVHMPPHAQVDPIARDHNPDHDPDPDHAHAHVYAHAYAHVHASRGPGFTAGGPGSGARYDPATVVDGQADTVVNGGPTRHSVEMVVTPSSGEHDARPIATRSKPRKRDVEGLSSRPLDAIQERPGQGDMDITELGVHPVERSGLSARQVTSPMVLINGPAKHRHSQELSYSTAPSAYSSALTAPPAAEVLTDSRRSLHSGEDADWRIRYDPDAPEHLVADGEAVSTHPASPHRRRSSVLGNISSWLPWGSESDGRESRRASRGDADELARRNTAECRLRGLLGGDMMS